MHALRIDMFFFFFLANLNNFQWSFFSASESDNADWIHFPLFFSTCRPDYRLIASSRLEPRRAPHIGLWQHAL